MSRATSQPERFSAPTSSLTPPLVSPLLSYSNKSLQAALFQSCRGDKWRRGDGGGGAGRRGSRTSLPPSRDHHAVLRVGPAGAALPGRQQEVCFVYANPCLWLHAHGPGLRMDNPRFLVINLLFPCLMDWCRMPDRLLEVRSPRRVSHYSLLI